MFSHSKLKVYDKALASVARLTRHSATWNKRHSVVDQLCRASESIVINLAEGARLWSAGLKQHFLDYATGSALECAACLDIAVVKEFLSPEVASDEKGFLQEVVRMLVGLRKSWEAVDCGKNPLSMSANLIRTPTIGFLGMSAWRSIK